MDPENEQFEDLPETLINEIKASDQPVSLITARVDREISAIANAQFSNVQLSRSRQAAWRRPFWVAVAATVLVALFDAQLRDPVVLPKSGIYADVDQSGRIDIADVLALARARDPSEVSQAELDAFAMRIVSIDPSGDPS